MKYLLLAGSIAMMLSACANQSLVDDIYTHAKTDGYEEAGTAFVALAHIGLEDNEFYRILEDYENEEDEIRRYYYEYLLAKVLNQNDYTEQFIASSINHLDILATNTTKWYRDIASPFYMLVEYYSNSNDDALVIVFKLTEIADAANLTIVVGHLRDVYIRNPERFSRVAQQAGVDERKVLDLMEI